MTGDYRLIEALRSTVRKLESGSDYQWGHMGSCNCGHLAQELTRHNKADIHSYAMQRFGDWNQQVVDYCPTSGLKIDEIIGSMLNAGLSIEDLMHLEKLSDPKIVRELPRDLKNLRCNVKEDVVFYLKAWINLLEDDATQEISLKTLHSDLKRSTSPVFHS